MNTCHICDRNPLNSPKPYSVRLPRMAFNEKLAYVESVCDVLLKSRFGPGYSYSYIDRQDHNAADEPVSLLDLIEDESGAWYAMLQKPARSKGISLQNPARRKGIGWPGQIQGHNLATVASNLSPSTFGRGSPQILRDSPIAVWSSSHKPASAKAVANGARCCQSPGLQPEDFG